MCWLIGGIQRDTHYHYINKMQVHIGLAMLLQRDWDEVAVVAFYGELACWQAAYPQERAEGPLQLHKAAELMATVMAWLHLKSREFDCRSAAWPLALPQTTWNYSYAHSWLFFLTPCAFTFECPALGYILYDQRSRFSNTRTNSRAPYCLPPFWCPQEKNGEAYLHVAHASGREWRKPDLAGQFGYCIEPKDRQSKTHVGDQCQLFRP